RTPERRSTMTSDAETRKLWLQIEAIVGDSEIELAHLDDGDPVLATHEPTEAELDELAGKVDPAALAAQRTNVDALVREAWERARERTPVRHNKRVPLAPNLSRADLLAMVAQLQSAHPQQFAQHYRNLDDMSDENLRALVEDMLALINDDPGDASS